MKSLARTSKLALLGVTGLLALPASADIGIYGGLQAGYASADTNQDVIELDKDRTYGIYGGYKFLDWLGAEVGYTRQGQFEADSVFGQDLASEDSFEIEMNSFHTALTLWGKFMGPVEVFAKIGAHYSEAKATDSNEDKENSFGFYYGAGFAFPVVDFMSVTLTYQNFRNIDVLDDIDFDDEDGAESSFGDAGIDSISLGVMFKF